MLLDEAGEAKARRCRRKVETGLLTLMCAVPCSGSGRPGGLGDARGAPSRLVRWKRVLMM